MSGARNVEQHNGNHAREGQIQHVSAMERYRLLAISKRNETNAFTSVITGDKDGERYVGASAKRLVACATNAGQHNVRAGRWHGRSVREDGRKNVTARDTGNGHRYRDVVVIRLVWVRSVSAVMSAIGRRCQGR